MDTELKKQVEMLAKDVAFWKNYNKELYLNSVSPKVTLNTSNMYEISLNLPGIEKNLINVRFFNNTLIVCVKTTTNEVAFEKSFTVPENSNIHNTTAKLNLGVLVIRIPQNNNINLTIVVE